MGSERVDVLVIGEALLDIVESESGRAEHPGGGPANVALGLGRWGLDVALLTDVGRDTRGSTVVSHLERSQVRVLSGSFSERPTSSAVATIGPDGSASYEFEVAWQPSSDVLPLKPAVVHTGSLAAFLDPGRDTVQRHVEAFEGSVVTFDPNIRPALMGSHADSLEQFRTFAELADVVKLSDEDAAWLYPGLTLDEVGDTIKTLGPRLVVVTRGADGALLSTDGCQVAVAAPVTAVVDTVGAGDAFMASLITDIVAAQNIPLTEARLRAAGEQAVRVAAITVSRAGADLPWRHELT